MLTYLQRWKVVNALYHLGRNRDLKAWVPEHDLIIWISGQDYKTHIGDDSKFDRIKFRFWYWFFRVKTHDQLSQKIRNVIYDCENIEPKLIRRTNGDDGISDHLCLSPRGMEVYAISHLIGKVLGNSWIKTIGTAIIVAYLVNHFIDKVNEVRPQTIQINGQETTIPQPPR